MKELVQTRSAESGNRGAREMRTKSGWQPIETAPEDGTSVLVVDQGVVSEAYYDGEDKAWWLANTAPHDFDPSRAIYPTRWRPLPAADEEDALETAKQALVNSIIALTNCAAIVARADSDLIKSHERAICLARDAVAQLGKSPSADGESALYESCLNPSSLNQPEPPHD